MTITVVDILENNCLPESVRKAAANEIRTMLHFQQTGETKEHSLTAEDLRGAETRRQVLAKLEEYHGSCNALSRYLRISRQTIVNWWRDVTPQRAYAEALLQAYQEISE